MRSLLLLVAVLTTTFSALSNDYEAQINARFQNVKTASYPASSFTKPMRWSVGQWVEVGITDDDNEKSTLRQAIIARDGEWWTLEMQTMNEDDFVIVQLEVKGMDKMMAGGGTDDIEFRKVRMKTNNDDPVTIEGFMLNMASGLYKDGLKSWVIETSNIKSGPAVTVPAGTFSGTSVVRTKLQVLGSEVESECWLSASVPISGIVKTADNEGNTQVLLDFGLEGAKASF